MSKTFQKFPDDKYFKNINPILYLWMFYSWLQDEEEKNKFAENYSILTGSFSNIKMAQNMLGIGKDHHTVTSTDFDTSFEKYQDVLEHSIEQSKTKKKKKKIIKMI